MLRQRYRFLRLQHLAAHAAMDALGQSLLGAGRCHGGIGYLGVSRCGKLLLFNQHLSADRAHASLGTAGFGTGRFHGGQDLDHVSAAGRRHGSAHKADLILRAGGVRVIGVSRRGNRLQTGQDNAAALASAPHPGGMPCRHAGRRPRVYLLRQMLQLGQDNLPDNQRSADRAVRTVTPAGTRAGRLLTGIGHFRMRQHRHILHRVRAVAADLAFLPFGLADRRTGRRHGGMRNHAVPGSGHLLLRGQHLMTDGAV